MKVCKSCGEEKPGAEFPFRNKEKGLLASKCKKCQREYDALRWAEGKLTKSNYEAKARRVKAAQDYLWKVLTNSVCVDCGETNPIVFEFDHIEEKFLDISKMVSQNYGVKAIQAEVSKCEVVCANCHKIRTSKRGNHWRYIRHTDSSSSV